MYMEITDHGIAISILPSQPNLFPYPQPTLQKALLLFHCAYLSHLPALHLLDLPLSHAIRSDCSIPLYHLHYP